MKSQKLKQLLRYVLGDGIAGWIHALRLARFAERAAITCKDGLEPELGLIPSILQPGDIAVDVGANGADWTLALSRAVGTHGKVFAFEADPYYAAVTEKVISLLRLQNVKFFPFGLSDKAETAFMRVMDSSGHRVSGTSFIDRSALATSDDDSLNQVKLKRLDDLSEDFPDLLRTRILKCDVEGFEMMVFRGAMKVLETARPIVVAEVGESNADDDLFRFFKCLNYSSFVLVSPGHVRPSEKAGRIPEGSRPNRIMIPNDKKFPKQLVVQVR
jgi:FkbM family methyltransferase